MGFGCSGFGWGGWMPWGSSMIGFLVLLGVLLVLGLALVLVLRKAHRRTAVTEPASSALETAKRRLASGELSVVEFEEIRDVLQK